MRALLLSPALVLASLFLPLLLLISWPAAVGFLVLCALLMLASCHYRYGLYFTIVALASPFGVPIGGIKIFLSEFFLLITVVSFVFHSLFRRQALLPRNHYTLF